MNEKVNKQINENVDLLINQISCNTYTDVKIKPLQEGVLGKILKALGFIDGTPQHRKFQLYRKYYNKCIETCKSTYEDEKTTYKSKSDLYNDLDNVDDRDIRQTSKMDEEVLKQNPEKAKCITRCRIVLLKSIIKLFEKEGRRICDKNVFKDECYEWIEEHLPDLEVELEYLEQAVSKIDKVKNDRQIQIMLNKLNKSFVKK